MLTTAAIRVLVHEFKPLSLGKLCVLIAVLAGCAEPPNNSAFNDQVPDVNEELTRLKDARWGQYEWPTVDNAMTSGTPLFAALAPPTGPGGCAVGLAEEGEILYLGTYGEASAGEAWNFGTVAPVGSVAKTFTALATMSLSERLAPDGQPYLELSDFVDDHLFTSSASLSLAQIDNLLDHTAGAGGATQAAAFSPNWGSDNAVADCLALNDPTACPVVSDLLVNPRFAFAFYESNETAGFDISGTYSNVGYSVLGAIIDEITATAPGFDSSERGYERYIWNTVGDWTDNILDARRMLSLALTHSWRVADGDFQSYARGFPLDAWEDNLGVEGWEGPSGGWTLTIGDLTRFAMLFGDDDFLSDDTRALMVQNRSTPLNGISYGLGVMLATDFPNRTRWWHGGVIGSHHALWAHWPNINGRSYSVALQCNNGPNNQFVWNVLQPAAVWLLNNALLNANEQPTLKTTIGGLTNTTAVNGAVYQLSFDAATFAQPANLFLPLRSLDNPVLSVKTDPRTRRLGLTVANPRGLRHRPVKLNTSSAAGSRYETSRADIALGSVKRQFLVKNAALRFGFSKDARQLADISLSGTIDVRQFGRLPYLDSWRDICIAAEDLGTACKPCKDGKRACLPVSLEHITARRIR